MAIPWTRIKTCPWSTQQLLWPSWCINRLNQVPAGRSPAPQSPSASPQESQPPWASDLSFLKGALICAAHLLLECVHVHPAWRAADTDAFLGGMDLNLGDFVFVIQGFHICGKYISCNFFSGLLFWRADWLTDLTHSGWCWRLKMLPHLKTCDHPNWQDWGRII